MSCSCFSIVPLLSLHLPPSLSRFRQIHLWSSILFRPHLQLYFQSLNQSHHHVRYHSNRHLLLLRTHFIFFPSRCSSCADRATSEAGADLTMIIGLSVGSFALILAAHYSLQTFSISSSTLSLKFQRLLAQGSKGLQCSSPGINGAIIHDFIRKVERTESCHLCHSADPNKHRLESCDSLVHEIERSQSHSQHMEFGSLSHHANPRATSPE